MSYTTSDSMRTLPIRLILLGCSLSLLEVACDRESSSVAPSGSASPSGSGAAAAPRSSPPGSPYKAEQVAQVLNPDSAPAYSGPTGSVRGTVVAKGDPSPDLPEVVDAVPSECPRAKAVYGKLFREGMMRSLADVLVTVTGYDGYLPPRGDAVPVKAYGCAWDRRTIALTFGQRLEVSTGDGSTYMPDLLGANLKVHMLAVPRADPVPLYPPQPGRYVLTEGTKPFMNAEVLVLKYPTHAVTGLDGTFKIDGIMPGQVTITAFLPATMQTAQQQIHIEANQTTEISLALPFDLAKWQAEQKPASTAKPDPSP